MWKSLRIAVVALTVSTLVVSPALACRWLFQRWSSCRPCARVCTPRVVYCPPVTYDPCGNVGSGCAGCGEVVHSQDMTPTPAPQPAEATVNKPAEEAPALPSDAPEEPNTFVPWEPVAPPTPMPPAEPEAPLPTVTLPELPEEPEDDRLTDPAEESPPPPQPEAPPMPPTEEEDDLFGPAPPEPAPVEPTTPDENLFGAPAEPAPVTPPAVEEPATPVEGADDLFGEVAEPADEPVAPAIEEPAAPAEEEMPAEDADDLFGDPAPTTDEAPTPADDAMPTDDAGDLFGTPATPPPVEEPSAPADDLFGNPAAPAPSSEPTTPEDPGAANDDLFSETIEDPSEAAMPAEDVPGADEAAPAEAPAAGDAEEDDLFGNFGAVLREPGGLASSELRTWVDNTGRYSCRGRMVEMLDGKVRLLKETGRTSTVALHRLSDRDLEFVNRQAAAERNVPTVGQTAQQ